MSSEESSAARGKALGLLARREHSQKELRVKLRSRGFATDEVETAIADLADQGLQSDERFLEAFVEGRAARGQGPLKIAAELRARGVVGEAVTSILDPHAPRWCELAVTVRAKRFGSPSIEPRERAAQMRFLTQRGFTSDQIRAALASSI